MCKLIELIKPWSHRELLSTRWPVAGNSRYPKVGEQLCQFGPPGPAPVSNPTGSQRHRWD